jgi:hypothetical protein
VLETKLSTDDGLKRNIINNTAAIHPVMLAATFACWTVSRGRETSFHIFCNLIISKDMPITYSPSFHIIITSGSPSSKSAYINLHLFSVYYLTMGTR